MNRAKNKERIAHSWDKVTETVPEEGQILKLLDKAFKPTVLNMFKELRRPQIKIYRKSGQKYTKKQSIKRNKL